MTIGVIEAVTFAAGEALNQAGGVRMTRLAQEAAVGDLQLVVERSLGLPVPGLVQVGGVTYRYTKLRDGALSGLSVTTPQGVFEHVQVAHAANTLVIDASRSASALDAIRRGLFVDTAEGEDLSILGRLLGVPRLADVSSDTVYRALIKAIAYGPRPTRLGLSAALDALVGPGNYVLTEDPSEPGVVQVLLRAVDLLNGAAQGKYFLTDERLGTLSDGAIRATGPLLRVTAVAVADVTFNVAATAEPFEQATVVDEALGDAYQPMQVTLGSAFAATQVFGDVPAWQCRAQGHLYAAGPADAAAVVGAQVVVPDIAALSATDGSRFMLHLSDGSRAVALGLFASGGRVGVALCDASGAATTPVLAAFDAQASAALRLEWDANQDTACISVNGPMFHVEQFASFASGSPAGASWGCFTNQSAQVLVLRCAATLRSIQDLGVASSSDLTAGAITLATTTAPPAYAKRFRVRSSVVRSGQLVDNLGAINHRLNASEPPMYLLWPIYLNEPTHLTQTYLQNMVALGVQVRVALGLEAKPQ